MQQRLLLLLHGAAPPAAAAIAKPPVAVPVAAAAPVTEAGLPSIAKTEFQRTVIPDIDVADQLELYKSSMPKDVVDPMAAERTEALMRRLHKRGKTT
jgi:hypothetical protein